MVGFRVYLLSNPSSDFIIYNFGLITGIGLGAGGMSTIVAIIGKTAPPEKINGHGNWQLHQLHLVNLYLLLLHFFSIKTFGWQTTIIFLSIIVTGLLLLIPLLKTQKQKNDLKTDVKEFNFKDVIKFFFFE